MRVDLAAATHAGHVRPSNEDCVFVDPARNLIVVADGMGGETGGEIASAAACQAIDDATRGIALGTLSLDAALSAAATAVSTGATTIAAVRVVADGTIEIAHVGDVRVYVVRLAPSTLISAAPRYCPLLQLPSGAWMACVTRDHTSICELVEHGHIDPTMAASHPLRSRVNRALGRDDPRADVQLVSLVDGDRILACTDGLWSAITDAAIAAIVEHAPTPRAAVDALVDSALAAGGHDNIGIGVLFYSSEGA